MGLRELKKAKTKKAISDMATLLFIERGYQNVTTAEVAERAEVSVPTLFNYFPSKEALVFDEDEEREANLLRAVTDRSKNELILDALLKHGLELIEEVKLHGTENFERFAKLIESTPELQVYSRGMWMRYELSLASTIRKESSNELSKIEAEAIASYILNAYHRAMAGPQPKASLRALFKILKRGWRE